MPKFTCQYIVNDDSEFTEEIEAKNEQKAFDRYMNIVPIIRNAAVEIKSKLINREVFEELLDPEILDEWRAFKAEGNQKLLDRYKEAGYLKMPLEHKEHFQFYFMKLISEIETRDINDEEIFFIKSWVNLNDRELGQSLIAKAESKRPKDQRGHSVLANTIVSGIAMGNLIKANQLNEMREMNETVDEIAEDVEDVNEGFGFNE